MRNSYKQAKRRQAWREFKRDILSFAPAIAGFALIGVLLCAVTGA